MKTKSLLTIAIMLFITIHLTSCSDRIDDEIGIFDFDNPQGFSFSSTTNIPIQLNVGRKALVHVYAGNPATERDAKEIAVVYTGNNGLYSGVVSIPTRFIGTKAYAVATDINIEAMITQNGIKFPGHSKSRTIDKPNTLSKEWCIDWSYYFRDHLKEKNDNYPLLNEELSHSDIVITKDGTKLQVAFLYSGASILAQMYYYYYPTDKLNELSTIDIYKEFHNDKFLMFKDCGTDKDGWINDNPDIVNNENVGTTQDLLYYDESGTPAESFPAGYSVGFFITSNWANKLPPFFTNKNWNSFSLESCENNGYASIGPGYDFSDGKWQEYPATCTGQRQVGRFTTDTDRTLIFGWEDKPADKSIQLPSPFSESTDNDFNDFIFAVSYSPEGGIDVSDDTPIDGGTEATLFEGTLLYEDLYPNQGDYDMNDLVIRFKYTKIISNAQETNQTIGLKCEFEPYHDGAVYTHDFFVALYDKDKNLYRTSPLKVFENHKQAVNSHKKYVVAFDAKFDYDIRIEQFDPYVHIQDTGYEVHLCGKHNINGKTDGLSPAELNYWSTEDKTYPYAMCIPTTDFKPVTEGRRIETDYPLYIQWAESKGTEAKDWYLSKNRSVN